jgi:predicted flap endonuclease-1-like 5' DNA nuclease
MNWCILIPLLVGAICAILGYLLGKLLGGGNDNDCEDRIAKLQADLEACRKSRVSLESDLKTTQASLASSLTAASTGTLVAFDAAAAKAVFGKKIKENDLTVVEGIGPKIQELFHNHDVTTWKSLSECSIEKCQDVLRSGGDRFKMHNPGTWPEQAKMAYEGNWKQLLKWQDELDGGK